MHVTPSRIKCELMVKVGDKDYFIEIAVDKNPDYETEIPKLEFIDITQK